MKAILKFFKVDGVLIPFVVNQEFSKGDKIKVDNLSDFIDGKVTSIYDRFLEVDLDWSSTQTKPVASCYKILGSLKMISNFNDESIIDVEMEFLNYGFAGKHPSNLYKIKCPCCGDFK